MKQYLQLLQDIKEKGTHKDAARANMPGTTSLFGYQFRHNLSEGFPMLTTKKIGIKGVVAELAWFLSGDTNVKFLDELGITYMWHEDAYAYYCKVASQNTGSDANDIYHDNNDGTLRMLKFDEFKDIIKNNTLEQLKENYTYHCDNYGTYTIGSVGCQYGWLWRNFGSQYEPNMDRRIGGVDQIKELLDGLVKNPMARRHIITAWNPPTLDKMALNACHAFVQFNCRPLTFEQKLQWVMRNTNVEMENLAITEEAYKETTPNYYLDCQLYQRSADSFLGVPLNIASYSLLTHIIAELCNFVVGDFIHTFGDVHIYDNHQDAVNEQLTRTPTKLPKLVINTEFWNPEKSINEDNIKAFLKNLKSKDFLHHFIKEDIQLVGYDPQEKIVANLSTGIQK